MNIITGYRGEMHITAAQDRAIHQGAFGQGSYILNVGDQLAAEIVTANEIRIKDGILMHQGCAADISEGTYDSLEISSGSLGMYRTDLIVARYSKDAGTNIESMGLVVIKGTAAASNPTTPTFNQGSIQAGDSPVDMPLYKVNIDGVSIDNVELIAEVATNITGLDSTVAALSATVTGAANGSNPYANVAGGFVQIGQIVNVLFEVTATQAISTSTGAISLQSLPNPALGNLSAETYNVASSGTVLGAARLQKGTSVPNLVLYGSRTSGQTYYCSFTYIAE